MPAISAKPTLASHSPVECGAFFSPSRSVRLRFLRVRRLFCGNPPAPRRMCAHFSARKIELRTSRPRFLRACRLFCGNLPAPLVECASAFSGNRRIGRLQPHFFACLLRIFAFRGRYFAFCRQTLAPSTTYSPKSTEPHIYFEDSAAQTPQRFRVTVAQNPYYSPLSVPKSPLKC